MGRVFFSFEAYEKALDLEIGAAMNDPASRVQVNAKSVITEKAEELVYNTYPNPGMPWSRRYNHNGILDPSTYNNQSSYGAAHYKAIDRTISMPASSNVKGFTTYISADTEWQQRFGGEIPHIPLAEAIENVGLYNAPPRPYMQTAETEYGEKHFANDLVQELEEAGF